MADQEHQFTTPVGRMIGGNLYKGKAQNDKGQPYIYKTGAKKGQPYQQFNFGVAFPKTPGCTHWAQEPWLQAVWALGHAAFPQGHAQRTDFSWKIIDGDSTEPNKSMKRPCDQEGYRGHWVIWWSGTQAPKICNGDGSQYITEENAVKPGYFVQVFCSVTGNTGDTPGLYWNAHYVALAAYGQEISFGPDMSAAGFGGAALPAGASATPPAGLPGGMPPPPPAGHVAPVGLPPLPAGVPSSVPAVGAMPPPPMAVAPVATYAMTAAANGWTREALLAQGHTDASLVAQGLMLPPAAPAAAPLPPLAGSVPGVPLAAPIAVVPNPQFTQMVPPPVAAGLPPPPAPPAPAAMATPTAKAEGRTLEQLLAMPGWNLDLLKQQGYVV